MSTIIAETGDTIGFNTFIKNTIGFRVELDITAYLLTSNCQLTKITGNYHTIIATDYGFELTYSILIDTEDSLILNVEALVAEHSHNGTVEFIIEPPQFAVTGCLIEAITIKNTTWFPLPEPPTNPWPPPPGLCPPRQECINDQAL